MHLPLPGHRRYWHWTGALAVATSAGLAVVPSAFAKHAPEQHGQATASHGHATTSHGGAQQQKQQHGSKHQQHGHATKGNDHSHPTKGNGNGKTDPRQGNGNDHGHPVSHKGGHGQPHHNRGHQGGGQGGQNGNHGGGGQPTKPLKNGGLVGRYAQTNLVADQPGVAQVTDPNLVNAWGLAFGPTTEAWISNAGTNTSTLYQGAVNGTPITPFPQVFNVPGGPTGQVFNGATNKFLVKNGSASGAAAFIFATVSGTIEGWNPGVPAGAPGGISLDAQVAVTVPRAGFTGLAINKNKLYAADFFGGKIDVFNGQWTQIKRPGAFEDSTIPANMHPFGVQTVGGNEVVTYAQFNPKTGINDGGPGLGRVDVFNKNGKLLMRLKTGQESNAPWGVAQAPQGFGKASGMLLVGNLVDGRINVYNPNTGRFKGQLAGTDGKPVAIPGLWALEFGNGRIGAPNQLLFTAGPNDVHGLFGVLTAGAAPTAPAAPPSGSSSTSSGS